MRDALAPYFLLTNRPVLAVVNVGEDDLDRSPRRRRCVAPSSTTPATTSRSSACACSSRPRPPPSTTRSSAPRCSRASASARAPCSGWSARAYHLLGLRTYFTTGEKETRAWTFYAGSTAPECAGRIHTDFQRGFIRAEVIHWDELLEIGSWNKAKDVGKIRIEGKDYVAHDGDVMEFRFNV